MSRLLLASLALLLAGCGQEGGRCAGDPDCQPAGACGPLGCAGGGVGGSGGGAGGAGGSAGAGGTGGAAPLPADAALCDELCRHLYLECNDFLLEENGGLIPFDRCGSTCESRFTEPQARCALEAACFAAGGCY